VLRATGGPTLRIDENVKQVRNALNATGRISNGGRSSRILGQRGL
jgi:hypothetical protein